MDLRASSNLFGFELLSTMNNGSFEENKFISPIGIYYALGMAASGATGETLNEMKKVMRMQSDSGQVRDDFKRLQSLFSFDETPLTTTVFEIANAAISAPEFYSNINEKYKGTLKEIFNTEVGPATGDIAEKINEWVYQKTRGKIPRMVDSVAPDEVFALLNAVYFKGIFKKQFDKNATHEAQFFDINGHKEPCQMMTFTKNIGFKEDVDFTSVSLDYEDDFSLTLVLPKEYGGKGMRTVADILRAGPVCHFDRTEVKLLLPKFKLSSDYELSDALKNMGMNISFTSGAEFKGITSDVLFVSRVVHKSFIEIDEEGTEAAAATMIMMKNTCMRIEPEYRFVRFDRPFYLAIKYKEIVLFAGSIVDLFG